MSKATTTATSKIVGTLLDAAAKRNVSSSLTFAAATHLRSSSVPLSVMQSSAALFSAYGGATNTLPDLAYDYGALERTYPKFEEAYRKSYRQAKVVGIALHSSVFSPTLCLFLVHDVIRSWFDPFFRMASFDFGRDHDIASYEASSNVHYKFECGLGKTLCRHEYG